MIDTTRCECKSNPTTRPLHDTSTTYPYQFIVSMDGTQPDQNPARVINAHIWFDGDCLPEAPGGL
jgi:hypothetical protein